LYVYLIKVFSVSDYNERRMTTLFVNDVLE